jgi:uncharacterized protein (DUF305 family)
MEISPARMKRPPRKARSGHPAVSRWAGAAVAAVLLISAGYVAGATSRSGAHVPAEGSADVGFLRDMMVHHSQAVTLAIIVLPRATTRPVREIAEETAIDQQREIGLMAGWLQQWGLPESTTTPAMAWMGHPARPDADPPMPGMADRRTVARLAVTRGRQADLLFCRLMLPHHLGALHMIDEVTKHGSRPEVIALAERMRTQQQREVTQLSRLIVQLSAAPTKS